MGIAAEHHHIPNGKIKLHLIFLGHDRQFSRQFFGSKFRNILSIQENGLSLGLIGTVNVL